MRTRRSIPSAPTADFGLCLLLSLAALVGCSADRVVAPIGTWEEVRYHWSEAQGDGTYGDLTIRSSGEMESDLQGQRASIRGLLAGENLETLTRLVDALPSANYDGAGSCERRLLLSVTCPEGRRSYATGDCDTGIPDALTTLIVFLDNWVADASEHRREAVGFRILARGVNSRLSNETIRIATDRDELLTLIDMAGGEEIGVIPAVDFRHEIVVGVFLGSRPTEGYEVDVESVYRTEEKQLVLRQTRIVPDPGCVLGETLATSPFVLVSIEMSGTEDVLNEIETVVRPCGDR